MTWEKARELRRLRIEGWTLKALGERYGISTSSAYAIVANQTWKEEEIGQ
jgi:lambda repressor-like predicted transcriptional regulator